MCIQVKICGLSSEEALDSAIEAGADYAGFVFFERSPRNVPVKRAAQLARRAEGHIQTVALIVDATDIVIEEIVEGFAPSYLQLHGSETVSRIEAIRSLSRTSIIKAIKVGSAAGLAAARDFEAVSDILLFDAQVLVPDALPGGNGLSFDWTWLPGASLRPDFMLSGGLNAGNVLEALGASGALSADVSSGVETSPGVKSPALIKQFVKIAKSFAPARAVSTGAA
jgi:phosphoribosylanthranilate isomerase